MSAPRKNVKLRALCRGNVLSESIRIKVAPGEMEKITIKADKLKDIEGNIEVSLEEIL